MLMHYLITNFNKVSEKIQLTEKKYHRPPGSALLLPVSKQQSTESIAILARHGVKHFAENKLQEAKPKIQALTDYKLNWHFIGPIQSNKTSGIAQHFSWVHSLDRLSIATRLNDQRPDSLPPLNICIQVNLSSEPQKQGLSPEHCKILLEQLETLPKLQVRGLMCIPKASPHPTEQHSAFAAMHNLYQTLKQQYTLDTLSMGMSNDFEAAIAEGATMVRIGQMIFSPSET